MWKSREAFEKSTFFKRLSLQGFADLGGLWEPLSEGRLRGKRSFRLNALRESQLTDFTGVGFKVGAPLSQFPQHRCFDFDLGENDQFKDHPLWGAGLAYVQDATAFEILADLDVQPGQWVLDLCAAPGGKSLLIAELLKNSGWLVSNDSDFKRARKLSSNLLRYGAHRSTVFGKDGVELCRKFPQTFNRLLLDAPCSGESLFFKRDDKRRDVYESEVQELAALQLRLLNAAAPALAAGGRMVYSTCTFNITENEETLRRFLKSHADFSLIKEERRWPHKDHCAGGYWAVLQKAGVESREPRDVLGEVPDVERNGFFAADNSLNLYAASMMQTATPVQSLWTQSAAGAEPMDNWILMDEKEARAYLHGEALPNHERKRGLQSILWKGVWPLGPVRGVENRFNNLLPLEVRS